MNRSLSPTFCQAIQKFFADYLVNQRNASVRTIETYRDSFRLLVKYLQEKRSRSPEAIEWSDFDTPTVLEFLDHLERGRTNSSRTRNLRLAALKTFFRYAASLGPEPLSIAERIRAIPIKKFERSLLDFLSRDEMEKILSTFDRTTAAGERDFVMFLTIYNTGMRVSEAVALCRHSVRIDGTSSIRIHGKGRKERQVPLWKNTAAHLKAWMKRNVGDLDEPLFPNRHGYFMTRSGIESRLRLAVKTAGEEMPSLKKKRVSPHTLRHTTAMHLLQSGVDITVIALWLGHESPATTHQYVESDLAMKEAALKKLRAPETRKARFQPKDKLLTFLESL